MAEHNYLSDNFSGNMNLLNECKGFLDVQLPIEPVSKYDGIGDISQFALGNVANARNKLIEMLEKYSKAYQTARDKVCETDGNYSGQLDDFAGDVDTLAGTFKSFTEIMQVSSSGADFLSKEEISSIKNNTLSGAAQIKISEYVKTNNGVNEYNNDKIDELFRKIGENGAEEIDYTIVEMLLLATCTDNYDVYNYLNGEKPQYKLNDLNTEELQYILNSSKGMISKDGNVYKDFWEKVSSDLDTYSKTLMYSNEDILTNKNEVSTNDYKFLVNVDSLSNIIRVYNEYTDEIQTKKRNEIANEKYSKQLEKNPEIVYLKKYYPELYAELIEYIKKYPGNVIEKLISSGGIAPCKHPIQKMNYFMDLSMNKHGNYAEQEKKRLEEECNTDIKLERVAYSNSVNDEAAGDHYNLIIGKKIDYTINDKGEEKTKIIDDKKVSIYEYSHDMMTTIGNAQVNLTKDEAIKYLNSLKNSEVEDCATADEYVNKKYTLYDKAMDGVDFIADVTAGIPGCGPAISGGIKVGEYTVKTYNDFRDNDGTASSDKETVDDASKGFTEGIGVLTGGSDIDTIKDGGKGTSSVIEGGTDLYDIYQKKEKLRADYERGKAYNSKIDEMISNLNTESKSEEMLKKINMIYRDNGMHSSFVVYNEGGVRMSDTVIIEKTTETSTEKTVS